MDFNALGVQAFLALVPVVTTLIVFGIHKVIPSIPRVALPILAAVLPLGVALLNNYIGGHQFSPLVAAALGAAATWLREIVNTISEHGLDPAPVAKV